MSIQISILLCLLFTMITGSIAHLVFKIICKVNKDTKVLKTRYILLKVVIIAFFIPVCFFLEMCGSYKSGLWMNTLFFATPALKIISNCILIVWVCGMAVRFYKWMVKSKMFRLSIKVYAETHEYDQVLLEIKGKLAVRRNIYVLSGDYYESPLCTGIISPKICLPSTHFSKVELENIFFHELIHHKHKDMWFLGIIKILEIVYWFHPSFRKNRMLLQYKELMEDACDIEVCTHINNYKSYIQVLLRMVLKSVDSQYAAPVFLSESYNDVVRRINNMEKYRTQKSMKRLIVTFIMVVVFCGSSIVVYAAETGVANAFEKIHDATWAGLEEEMNGNTENTLEEVYELASEVEGITVEYVDDEITTYSTVSYVDYTIAANAEKRKTTKHALKAGDKILVSLTVDPDNKNVKVGFYMSNGYVRYITGSGNIYHTFTIYDDDNYGFFVQNNNSVTVDVDGYYSIQ